MAEMRSEAPQILRVTRSRPEGLEVHLLGGAAGPLGGDDWRLDLDIAAGTSLALRSVAATLAQPDPRGRASRARVFVCVGDHACLDAWWEPVISVRGSRHHLEVTLEIAPTARVRWVDEIRQGRHGEPGGEIRLTQRVLVDGRVRSMQHLDLGPKAPARGPGGQGDDPLVVTAFANHPGGSAAVVDAHRRAVRCDLGEGWATWTALGTRRNRVHEALGDLGLGGRDTEAVAR